MQSEFYHLRRTAIKDLSAYCGFLLGFLGSAPLAWDLLAGQLDAGNFARGLWYFCGIVTGAGIFSGIAGLGLGSIAGLSWEQLHRYRRRKRAIRRLDGDMFEPSMRTSARMSERTRAPAHIGLAATAPPALQLVSPSVAPFPELTGRRIQSVRFLARTVEIDFGGVTVEVSGTQIVTAGSKRFRYPEPGSRDALCVLIGSCVQRMRTTAGNRAELRFDTGWELVISRGSSAVA